MLGKKIQCGLRPVKIWNAQFECGVCSQTHFLKLIVEILQFSQEKVEVWTDWIILQKAAKNTTIQCYGRSLSGMEKSHRLLLNSTMVF